MNRGLLGLAVLAIVGATLVGGLHVTEPSRKVRAEQSLARLEIQTTEALAEDAARLECELKALERYADSDSHPNTVRGLMKTCRIWRSGMARK